jgi:hypothetical protein
MPQPARRRHEAKPRQDAKPAPSRKHTVSPVATEPPAPVRVARASATARRLDTTELRGAALALVIACAGALALVIPLRRELAR